MEWLLGGASVGGIAGVVILGVYMARMAGSNRSDLRELVQSTKDLAAARRDNDGYKRAVESLENALEETERGLARSGVALKVAEEALSSARSRLVATGDPVAIAADINASLGRLSKMSAVPNSPSAAGGEGADLVHGSSTDGSRRTGL